MAEINERKEKVILKKIKFHRDEVLERKGSSDETVRLVANIHKSGAEKEVLKLVSLLKPKAGLSLTFIKEFFVKEEEKKEGKKILFSKYCSIEEFGEGLKNLILSR